MKFVILAILLLLSGCSKNTSTPINEEPMYGGKRKSFNINKNDKNYLKYKEKSKNASVLGWKYLRNGDDKTAMKRFNQAWLLDPNNSHVYWGFGIILGEKGKKEDSLVKLNKSIEMLNKARKLDPNNARLMVDFGNYYASIGYYNSFILKEEKKGKKYFVEAEQIYEKAMQLDPSYARIYFNWSTDLFYQKKYKQAWEKLLIAKELKYEIPSGFVTDLKKHLPDNYKL